MKINLLSDKIGWFGKYSGYECLPNYFPNYIMAKIYIKGKKFSQKFIGKLVTMYYKWPTINPIEAFNEMKFILTKSDKAISHILYLDAHLHIISKISNSRRNIIGTIHIPFSFWSLGRLQSLSQMENVIILYERDIMEFGKFIPLSKIHFIRHGVDVDFFKPLDNLPLQRNKILFVGHFLRNFDMFLNVYNRIVNEISSEIEFHFIIPGSHRDLPVLCELIGNKNIFFYENLSDEELLRHYQESYLLLMPMTDSGANTAIIQALSCGLPVLTTDIGGIRSYGGDACFPTAPNNDVDAMFELFRKYYFDPEFRNLISSKVRDFALNYLDWKIIADQHVQLYKEIFVVN